MTDYFISATTKASDSALNAIAHLPTEHLHKLVSPEFWHALPDAGFMCIATLLAQKSYDEGGCPIGGVIIDAESRRIIGKGHNMLGQENDSTTHGETAALRDAVSKGVEALCYCCYVAQNEIRIHRQLPVRLD